MQTSEAINEIAAALAKAQGAIKNPSKAKENPHFKSKYADMATGLDVIRPALSEHAIAIVQATEIVEDGVILRTRLIHSSGQWLESSYPVSKFAPHQQLGSALTYSKRQALFALVGVHGEDEDDDGETAAEPAQSPPPRRERKPEAPKPAGYSEEQSEAAKALLLTSLDLCHNRAELQDWATKNQGTIQQCSEPHKVEIRRAFGAKQQEIAPLKSATAAE